MHIKKISITNIRAIRQFEMTFQNPAGWHVLIGDNGAGKSSIIRSMALALVGPEQAHGLRADWRDWLNRSSNDGAIVLELKKDANDKLSGSGKVQSNSMIPNEIIFKRNNGSGVVLSSNINARKVNPTRCNWGDGSGWFSVAYGPYRRFVGGNPEWTKVFYSQPKLGAHLSVFGEDVALTEALDWLVKLNYQELEKQLYTNTSEPNILEHLKTFINSPDFLPHGSKIESISSEGVLFKDGNGNTISVTQMSDGYRSILSLTFELIRQLVRVFSPSAVFRQIRKGNMVIDLSGVVLIDEIDVHLHPSWQTRIGQWFTKYFPNIQFIVSTHSPLICRSADKGSIWRLAAPGSGIPSSEITGIEKERLIYGNILDAYGTEVFGKEVVRSEKSNEKLERLGRLNIQAALGKISEEEEVERKKLNQTLVTDAPTGFDEKFEKLKSLVELSKLGILNPEDEKLELNQILNSY
jgi:hypothetical protein